MSQPIAPTTLITDTPIYCLTINAEWAQFLIGALLPMTDIAWWGGDDEDKVNGTQGIETFLDMLTDVCP